MSERYRLRRYWTPDGECPIQEFLEKRKKSDRPCYTLLISALNNKLRDEKNHHGPLFKPLTGETNLFELRLKKSGARVFMTRRPNALLVVLFGIIKKKDELDPADVERARKYRDDYQERCAHDEDGVDEQF